MNYKKNILSLAVTLGLSTSLVAAETEPKEKEDLFEVINVTASKRTESIQKVPVSISAISGEQLDALGLNDTTEITQQIPNFQVNAWSPQITIFNLRGVSQNNFVDNLEAPIAVYQDEAYLASMNAISGQMFDIERVEVLRGPQGTLFGRNATGGLVHYISRSADEDELNGYVDLSYGSFNRQSIEGAIGGALSDTVRARVAVRHETADGYIKAMKGIPSVDDRAIGGADGYGIRAVFEVDFSDNLLGQFILKHAKDKDVPTGGYAVESCDFDADGFCPVDQSGRAIVTGGVVSGDPHVHMNDTRGFLDREVSSYTAKLTYEMDSGLEFVSITNQMTMDKSYLEDGDAFPDPIVVFGQDAEVDQFSQEFRLSNNEGHFKWQVGVYYMDYQMQANALTVGAPNIDLSFALAEAGVISTPVVFDDNPLDGRSDREYQLDMTNQSVFGQIDYDLAEDLTLTAGLRYSKDDKDINWVAFFTSDQETTPIPYAATASNSHADLATIFNRLNDDSIDYSDHAIRLSLRKEFNAETMGFVSYNRGIKGGNWTLSSSVSADKFTHDPEVLNSFEAGIKTQLTATTRLNATAYYYDYQDYQTFVAIPAGEVSPNPQIGNSDATAYGAEFDLISSPLDSLDMVFGLALGKSEVEQIEAGASPVIDAEFPNAPGISGNYLFRYYHELSENNLVFQFDGAFYGDQFLEVTNGPGTEQEAYNVSNFSVTYEAENWSVSLWSKNIFDETYKAYSLDLGVLGATSYYAPPRTSGVTVKFQF